MDADRCADVYLHERCERYELAPLQSTSHILIRTYNWDSLNRSWSRLSHHAPCSDLRTYAPCHECSPWRTRALKSFKQALSFHSAALATVAWCPAGCLPAIPRHALASCARDNTGELELNRDQSKQSNGQDKKQQGFSVLLHFASQGQSCSSRCSLRRFHCSLRRMRNTVTIINEPNTITRSKLGRDDLSGKAV